MNLFHSISVTSPLRLPPEMHRSLNTPSSKRKLISLTSSRLLRKSAHCQQSWQKDQNCLLPPDSRTTVVVPCVCSSTTSLILSSHDLPSSFPLAASIPDPGVRTVSDGLLHVHPRLIHSPWILCYPTVFPSDSRPSLALEESRQAVILEPEKTRTLRHSKIIQL